jgi:GTP-binding protein
MHYANSVRQAPQFATPGAPGEERELAIELKLIADCGLVGFPNAGKSTLLSVLTRAKPKIADYPFTTLEPSLGIVSYRNGSSFVMADIPGIIEGASEGRGIGLRFLRHIERNSLLLFLVSCESDNIKKDYEILLNELKQFNPEMLTKKRILAVTKCDIIDDELVEMLKEDLPDDLPVVFISAVSGYGVMNLKDVIWKELNSKSNKIEADVEDSGLVHRDLNTEEIPLVFPDYDEDDTEFDDGEIIYVE